MDNIDHDPTIDKYALRDINPNENPLFEFKAFANTDGNFRGIVYQIGVTGFLIVRKIIKFFNYFYFSSVSYFTSFLI